MAISITRKEPKTQVGGRSYIMIYGQLRDDIRTIAAQTGRTSQDVGESLLKQAVEEVMPTLEQPEPYKPRKRRS